MSPIKVILVDDHDVVRRGMKTYLMTEEDIEIIGEASSGNEGAQLVLDLEPDVVLMDLIMENGTGIEATEKIIAKNPDCKIIILTSFYDEEQVIPALEAGAFSYMLKTSSAEEIVSAIRKAKAGENVIEPKAAGAMMNRLRTPSRTAHDELTRREREVLICIGNGLTNQEIGDELFIGIKTVKTHVSNILSKPEVQGRTQAAVYAHRNGLMKEQA